ISSGLCFFAGIRRPFLDPDSHSRWTAQKGAAQVTTTLSVGMQNSRISHRAENGWKAGCPPMQKPDAFGERIRWQV
ncbi:hypothetical protein, partial [Sphingomonas sp. PP-CE-1A-559]|uniref:hypothetical protein n=1 Tax=Sphingomonas sp. PP-CE-1A-559 TaxID=2135657 RepID=UPI001A9FD7A2